MTNRLLRNFLDFAESPESALDHARLGALALADQINRRLLGSAEQYDRYVCVVVLQRAPMRLLADRILALSVVESTMSSKLGFNALSISV